MNNELVNFEELTKAIENTVGYPLIYKGKQVGKITSVTVNKQTGVVTTVSKIKKLQAS